IGTDITAYSPLGNAIDGVAIVGGASRNWVGGATDSAANVIGFNKNDGVFIDTGNQNGIRRNVIYYPANLGIELQHNGNKEQAYPVLTSVIFGPDGTTIQGTLTSTPNTMFVIEFYLDSVPGSFGFGEGEQFFGAITVTTNGSGQATFMATYLDSLD